MGRHDVQLSSGLPVKVGSTRRSPVSRGGSTRDERGAVLVISAIVIVVLMIFAALTVDLGLAWAVRRGEQTAADVSVLAAAVEFQSGGATAQGAVDELITFAVANADRFITTSQWNSCVDPEALGHTANDLVSAGVLTGPATDCISFSEGGDEIRVRLPDNPVSTSFGRLAGIDVINVSAAANATIKTPTASNSPPFVVLAGRSAGDEVCLRTSSSGSDMPGLWVGNGVGPGDDDNDNLEDPLDNDPTHPLASEDRYVPDPCDETAFSSPSQFFGTLNPWLYKDANPASKPDTSCRQPGSNVIDLGIADGIDHNLSSFEPDYPGSPILVDGDIGCLQLWPNTMETQTGFSAQRLKCGLIGTSAAGCGSGPVFDSITFTPRFQRGPDYTPGGATFAGRNFENLPLWDYFRPDVLSVTVPTACQDLESLPAAANWDYYDKKEFLLNCLTSWNSSYEPLFDDRILQSGRFAFIPQLAESALAGSVHFNQFVPIWFQKMYQSGSSSGNPDPMCFSQAETATGNSGWYWHEAGQPFNCGKANQNVDRLSGIVLDCGMFPEDTCIPDGSPTNPGGDPVFRILLSK